MLQQRLIIPLSGSAKSFVPSATPIGANIRAYQNAADAAKDAMLRRNETIVKRLVALVTNLEPRPASSPTALAAPWPSCSRLDRSTSCSRGGAARPAVARVKIGCGRTEHASHASREHIRDLGAQPVIPTQRHEAPVVCRRLDLRPSQPDQAVWAILEEQRAVAAATRRPLCSLWPCSALPPHAIGSEINRSYS